MVKLEVAKFRGQDLVATNGPGCVNSCSWNCSVFHIVVAIGHAGLDPDANFDVL